MRAVVPLVTLLLLGCASGSTRLDAGAGDDAGPGGGPDDAGRDDASLPDAGDEDAFGDAGQEEDAGEEDDAGQEDDAFVDAGPDLGRDAGPECAFLDLTIFLVPCGSGESYLRHWTPTSESPASCDDYWTLGRARFPTREAALTSDGCDATCLRQPSTSVTLLRCGRRTGYIEYRDAEDDCAPLLETPDGLFESVEAWNEAAPCP
ncbi:MAG: hypothetical protein AAF447_18810 [Myxococcota bacterium]